MKKLAIVTVVYENYAVMDDLLESLKKQTDTDFELFIADLSLNKKPIEASFPLQVVFDENRGYAHGVNTGIEKAMQNGYELFAIINNDTTVSENFVQAVKQSLQIHPHSLIGGKIYYAKGFEYHKNRYKKTDLGTVIWYAGGIIDWNHVITHHRGVDEVDTGLYTRSEETQFITGCLMCFDKHVFQKVGRWDESYFLYYEDSDYCERAKRKGIKLYYDPSIEMWHKNAQSTEGSGSNLHSKYQEKNRVWFGLKYAPWRTKLHLIKNSLYKSFSS